MGSTSGEGQLPARREAAHLFHFQQAADQGRWADAVAALERLLEAAADYPSAAQRLEQARARRQVADLQADLRRRHKARQWAAVLAASEQLTALDPAAADPDGLVSRARDQLARAEQTNSAAADRRRRRISRPDTTPQLPEAGKSPAPGTGQAVPNGAVAEPVSYTHLTLPTIYSV